MHAFSISASSLLSCACFNESPAAAGTSSHVDLCKWMVVRPGLYSVVQKWILSKQIAGRLCNLEDVLHLVCVCPTSTSSSHPGTACTWHCQHHSAPLCCACCPQSAMQRRCHACHALPTCSVSGYACADRAELRNNKVEIGRVTAYSSQIRMHTKQRKRGTEVPVMYKFEQLTVLARAL